MVRDQQITNGRSGCSDESLDPNAMNQMSRLIGRNPNLIIGLATHDANNATARTDNMEHFNINPVAYVQISCSLCGEEWDEEMVGICGGDYAHDYRGTPECPNGCDPDADSDSD
jgi:hypothetical protein